MSFYKRITRKKLLKENSMVGDIARDISDDSTFPTDENDILKLHAHLFNTHACSEAHECLDKAWARYKKREYKNFYLEFLNLDLDENDSAIEIEIATTVTIRRSITPKIRFDVFKRDGYRCQICGRTAQDGAKLELDHKRAVANGGNNDRDNLWTLCFDCNRGKRTSEV